MSYKSLQQCVSDLEKNGELNRVKDEINPDLDIASIHLNEFEKGGKSILFENVKGSKYKAVSNLFGTLDRSKFMFRDSLEIVKQLIELKTNPISALKNPFQIFLYFIKWNLFYSSKSAFSKKF